MQKKNLHIDNRTFEVLFNKFASAYEIVDLLSFGISNTGRKINLPMKTRDPITIVDLMCGMGNNFKLSLRRSFDILSYSGIDFSSPMLIRAKKKYRKNLNAHFYKGNILDPTQLPEAADLVLCTYGLKCLNVSDYSSFSRSVSACLKPEGEVRIIEFQSPKNVILRNIFYFYLNSVYKLGCILSTGSSAPALQLIQCLKNQLDIPMLIGAFKTQGILIEFTTRWNGILCIGKGKKSHPIHEMSLN